MISIEMLKNNNAHPIAFKSVRNTSTLRCTIMLRILQNKRCFFVVVFLCCAILYEAKLIVLNLSEAKS